MGLGAPGVEQVHRPLQTILC